MLQSRCLAWRHHLSNDGGSTSHPPASGQGLGGEPRDGFRLFSLPSLEQEKWLQNTPEVTCYSGNINALNALKEARLQAALVAAPLFLPPPLPL